MAIHLWILTALAVVRVVRFVNLDVLAEPIREAAERRFGPNSKIAYLLSCPWCASIWIAGAVVPTAYAAAGHPGHTAYEVVASVLAVSYLAGLADRFLEPDDQGGA